MEHANPSIQIIPINKIRVVNPRSRNKKIFAELVDNIALLGLKRPIKVSPTKTGYDLICGQGRMEAYQVLGSNEIPAIVTKVSEEDLHIMSLSENIARRKHSNEDLLYGIKDLEDRGYSPKEISKKTGLDPNYVRGISHLLNAGEERLIAAVEKGTVSLSLAVEISRGNDTDLQKSLTDAYESGELKGDQLLKVRRIVSQRRHMGKRYGASRRRNGKPLSTTKLVQAYQDEVNRQKLMIKKADINEQRLLILVSALRHLMSDEHFKTLLRAEGFNDMPEVLAEKLKS
ncbi:plasmid partitioning protein RepB C-terminal domain-containing protein [Terasakiella sp. SH-1]|uniref:plasmid partitioning protein RepB C-terminal domain-containing protein n=1 Tax=Terasakiella sp. SH-1 TaxID=2560057 RepID=UPI00107358D9|nr:plasmid partitioning protein RepB C-terminal domain-containing protein [Terasakiella sp. SH-1]